MTKKYKKDFKNSNKCWICKTGKNEGFAHHHWNLSLSLSKKNPVVFHDLQNYGSHLIFQEIAKFDSKINVIPKTIGRYMSFII